MKYEWRKLDKKLYQGPKTPVVIEHPVQSFIMLNGQGNPNKTDFSERVSALYSLAYAIKMEYKKLLIIRNLLILPFTLWKGVGSKQKQRLW